MHVVIGGVGERGHRPQAVAIHPIGRGDLSIRQICADAGVVQRGHELVGRLLQRQHLNALVAYRIHNRLRIGLPLVHIRRHHTGIPVGRIRLSGGHRGGSLRRQLDLRHEERILPPDLQTDAATATNATIQRREISANSSASTAATTNHGVADTITGTYGNACNCSGSARAPTPTTATSAHNPDRMRSTYGGCGASASGDVRMRYWA